MKGCKGPPLPAGHAPSSCREGRAHAVSSDETSRFDREARAFAAEIVGTLIQDRVVDPNDEPWFLDRSCRGLPGLCRRRWEQGDDTALKEVLHLRLRNLADFRYLRPVQYTTLWSKLVNRARGIVRDPVLAEDMVQMAFVRATRGGAGYRGDGSYETWLSKILWHVILTEGRRDNLVPNAGLSGLTPGIPSVETLQSLAEFLYCPRQTPEKKAWEREIVGKLFERIRVILTDSYSYRAIFLTFVEGKSAKEVAHILGVTVSHYYKILANARKRLRNSPSIRELLELEGIHARPSHTPAGPRHQ